MSPERASSRAESLRRNVLGPDESPAPCPRAEAWRRELRPREGLQSWLVDQAAALSLRVERSRLVEPKLRDRHALRALTCWEGDRRRDAEALGSRLALRPAATVARLEATPQGIDWLRDRWALLAQAAEVQGHWTPEQSALAFDLLGTPAEFREGRQPGDSVDAGGRLVEPEGGPGALARRQVEALSQARASAAGSDEVERSLTASGYRDESCPELRRHRRYEAGLLAQLRWCLDRVRPESPEPEAPPAEAGPDPRSRAEPPAEDGPDPLRPGRTPAVAASRRLRRARKVEARREARLRERERSRT